MRRYWIFALFIVALSLSSSQPVFQYSQTTNSIQIETPAIEYHKINTNMIFHAHPHNSSNGELINTGDIDYCFLHLYNPINGSHLLRENMTSDGLEFELTVLGGNFSDLGRYEVMIYCQVNQSLEHRGGFFEYSFEVTQTGSAVDTGETLMYIIILLFLVMFLSVGIYFSITIPYRNIEETKDNEIFVTRVTKTKYVKIIAMWLSYGIFLLIITILAGMTHNYIQFIEMKSIFSNTYFFLKIVGYGINVFFVCLLFLNTWKDIILNKKILRDGKALLNP